MATLTTTRPVTRKIVEDVQTSAQIEMRQTRKGGVELTINGKKLLAITSTGYLRRFPGLTAEDGVRRNKQGKIAFKKATAATAATPVSDDSFEVAGDTDF